MKILLPLFGLVLPPLLYLIFFGINSSAFSALGLSSNNMLISVGIISLIIWIWSSWYARSVNKYFRKKEKGNFKNSFGVQSISETFQLFIWLFISVTFASSNPFSQLLIILLLMLLVGNIFRIWLTSFSYEVDFKTATNANKFNLIWEIILYGPAISISFVLGGYI